MIAKIDQHVGKVDLLTVRYFFGDSDQSFPLGLLGGGFLPGYNTDTPTTVQLLSGSFTHLLSTKLLLEVRGGYNRFDEDVLSRGPRFRSALDRPGHRHRTRRISACRRSACRASPTSAPTCRCRAAASTATTRPSRTFRTTPGRHNWKAGYEFRRTTVDGFFDAGYRGRLDFDSLEDFVAGRLAGGRQAKGDSQRFTFQNTHAFYLQDTFQARRNVTLNWGVRWDYYGVIGADGDRFSVFDTAGQQVTPVTQLYDKDWNNFSPRVSAAWDLTGDGKRVVRAGYGLYYDAFSQDFFVGQLPWNTFNPGPAYNDILFSFSPVSELVAGRAGVRRLELQRLGRLHGRPGRCARRTCRSTTSTTSTSSVRARPFRSATSARSGAIAVPLPRHQPARSGDGRGAVSRTSSTSTSSSRRRDSRYNSLQASLRMREWKGLTLHGQLHAVEVDGHRQRRPGLRAERVAARRQPQPRGRVGAVELRRAPPLHVVLHLEHHAGLTRAARSPRAGR